MDMDEKGLCTSSDYAVGAVVKRQACVCLTHAEHYEALGNATIDLANGLNLFSATMPISCLSQSIQLLA